MTDGAGVGPLAGIVVVAVEQAVSAPFASRQLADLGATVIKIERPGGDFARHYDAVVEGESAHFVWANRGKESVVLDLKHPGDRETLFALIAAADVFLHNLSRRAAGVLGIDAPTLHAAFPRLVAAEVSGYGAGGPRSSDKAYDLAVQAEAGVFSVTGGAEMSKVGFPVADVAAAMYALSSILAALFRRERTGLGAAVEVSMLDSLAEWVSAPMYAAVYGDGQAERTGRRHHGIAPYGTFELSDGSTILLAVQNDHEWKAFAEVVLERPELVDAPGFAGNPARIARVDEVERLVSDALLGIPADEALRRLGVARITVAGVNDLRGVWGHEQLRSRDRFVPVETPSGTVEMLAAPFALSDWTVPAGRVPALGEHDPDTLPRLLAAGRLDQEGPTR
jgi:crotonobetainyl-CoA:carnitine CoA-transferase CaiB-like acyl-CoA transferase